MRLRDGTSAALFCAESPQVWFYDIMVVDMPSKVTAVPVDTRFVDVCEPGTFVIACVCPEFNLPWRATLVPTSEGPLVLDLWAESPVRMTVTVAGIRKGFAGVRFPYRTEQRRLANNHRWAFLSGVEIPAVGKNWEQMEEAPA